MSTACPTSGTTGTLYWRGTGSDTLDETDLAGNALEDYVFFNGARIARRDVSNDAVHFYFSDQVGSHAVVENATGTACEQDIDYYPYGGVEEDYCSTPVAQHYKFTGKERDAESMLDDFVARYDSSNLGRFMTPDWAEKPTAVPYAHFGNPQSLNLYAYVENNPTTLGDPDGHVPWGWGGLGGGCEGSAEECQQNKQQQWGQSWLANAQKVAAQNTTPETLPSDPSKLGPEWVKDDTHKNPNGERYGRGDGTKVDFDKGQKGAKGWRGKDHWHVIRPGENKPDKSLGDRGHIAPGTTVDLPTFAPKFSPTVPIPSELLPNPVLPPIFPMPIPGGVTPDIPMPAIPPLMPAPELVPI